MYQSPGREVKWIQVVLYTVASIAFMLTFVTSMLYEQSWLQLKKAPLRYYRAPWERSKSNIWDLAVGDESP